MAATWDNDFDALDNESSCNEDDSPCAIRTMITVIMKPSNTSREYSSRKDDEDEDAEDIQLAFDKLYIEIINPTKANTKLKKKNKESKEKSTSLVTSLDELCKTLSEEVDEKKRAIESNALLLRKMQELKSKIRT